MLLYKEKVSDDVMKLRILRWMILLNYPGSPNCNHKCLNDRQEERIHVTREAETWSDAATSQEMLAATKDGKGQEQILPWTPRGHVTRQHLDFNPVVLIWTYGF